jgi:hypothetical protein
MRQRASEARTAVTATVLAIAVLTSCGAGGGGAADGGPTASHPASASSSSPVPSAPATPTPVELTAARATRAFAEVEVPAGLETDVQCPPGTANDRRLCLPAEDAVAWAVARTYLGRELPRANGLTETVTLNLATATSEQAALALYRRKTRALERYDGAYEVPAQQQGGGTIPGERGRGTLRPTTAAGWSGVDLSRQLVIVFDSSTSGRLASGTQVLRRGAHVLDVRWTVAPGPRSGALADLPDQVVAALGPQR